MKIGMLRCFDANCFIGAPLSPILRCFATADDLLREMDAAGIERAAVCHFLAQAYSARGNRRLMEAVRGRDRLLPCWVVNLNGWFAGTPEPAEILRRLGGEGIRMVRVQPGWPSEHYALHPWIFGDLLAGLAERGIVLYIDFIPDQGRIPEAEWGRLHAVALAHPALKIILFSRKLSICYPHVLGMLRTCPNVSLDLSSLQMWRATERIVAAVGADRMIFGSYAPMYEPIQFVIQLQYAQITAEERSRIAFSNLAGLLRWPA